MPLPLDLKGRPEDRVLRQLVGALLFEGVVDAREHIQGDAVEFQWSLGGRDYRCRGTIGPFGRLRLVPGSVEVREGADNWIAPALTLIGGIVFGFTYERTRSSLVVAVQHALFGCFLFTIGLGWFFYSGGGR